MPLNLNTIEPSFVRMTGVSTVDRLKSEVDLKTEDGGVSTVNRLKSEVDLKLKG